MQTIDFVLRSRVGSFQNGSLTGESGSTTIFLQTGDQVSLHLARHQVAGYERKGSNLIVKLADGRQIVLSDYFSADAGEQPRVSTNHARPFASLSPQPLFVLNAGGNHL